MDQSKKGHFVNINSRRKSWCLERYSFNIDDRCINREEDSQSNQNNNQKIKYRFDYRENSCKKLETNQCTFNGNVFNTIEECLVDCLPSKFECSNCDIGKFNKLKAQKCKTVTENTVQCGIKYKTFLLAPLQTEVEKIRSNSAALPKFNSTNIVKSILIILIAILNFKNPFFNSLN